MLTPPPPPPLYFAREGETVLELVHTTARPLPFDPGGRVDGSGAVGTTRYSYVSRRGNTLEFQRTTRSLDGADLGGPVFVSRPQGVANQMTSGVGTARWQSAERFTSRTRKTLGPSRTKTDTVFVPLLPEDEGSNRVPWGPFFVEFLPSPPERLSYRLTRMSEF